MGLGVVVVLGLRGAVLVHLPVLGLVHVLVLVPVRVRRHEARRDELHPALRAPARRVARHLGVHRADVGSRPLGLLQLHLGDEGEDLVRLGGEVGLDPPALGRHVRVRPQDPEGCRGGRLERVVLNADPGEPVRALRRPVLERELAGLGEEDVDYDALRGRDQDLLDDLLALIAPAVAPDELHAGARQRDVEHPCVRRVREVQAHDLAPPRGQREGGIPCDQHHVPEAAHRHVGRLRMAEGSHLAVLDEDVVER
jgi:hypothetical protein